MKLYQIPLEAQGIEAALEAAEGELSPRLEAQIQEFLAAGAEKIEAAACVLKSLQAQAEACAEEESRLQARRLGLKRNAAHLRQLMLQAVEALGGKVKTPLFTIWTQQATEKVEIGFVDGFSAWDFLGTSLLKSQEAPLDREEVMKRHKLGILHPGVFVTTSPGAKFLRVK